MYPFCTWNFPSNEIERGFEQPSPALHIWGTSTARPPLCLLIQGLTAVRAKEHRDKAAECEHRAAQTRDADAKARYLDLAKSWRLLAEQTEGVRASRGRSPKDRIRPDLKAGG